VLLFQLKQLQVNSAVLENFLAASPNGTFFYHGDHIVIPASNTTLIDGVISVSARFKIT
jgi:hypothetical protein